MAGRNPIIGELPRPFPAITAEPTDVAAFIDFLSTGPSAPSKPTSSVARPRSMVPLSSASVQKTSASSTRKTASPRVAPHYADFEPYYCRAEELFAAHGSLNADLTSPDPTEPFHSKPYPFPALPSEPRMRAIHDDIKKLGFNPFPVPLGLKRNTAHPIESKCIRCDTCDGYPCLVHAKSDSDINCIRQLMHLPNVTLLTEAKVINTVTNSTGTAVTYINCKAHDLDNLYVVDPSFFPSCGAVNPSLTIIANAIRIADHLVTDRLTKCIAKGR